MQPPKNIRHHKKSKTLELVWDDVSATLSAEYLRVHSPSAEVKGHGPGQETTQFGKRDVAIKQIEFMGHYAIKITFDDGHDTGIFTWEYLRKLHDEFDQTWQTYLDLLASEKLSRDPDTTVVRFMTP